MKGVGSTMCESCKKRRGGRAATRGVRTRRLKARETAEHVRVMGVTVPVAMRCPPQACQAALHQLFRRLESRYLDSSFTRNCELAAARSRDADSCSWEYHTMPHLQCCARVCVCERSALRGERRSGCSQVDPALQKKKRGHNPPPLFLVCCCYSHCYRHATKLLHRHRVSKERVAAGKDEHRLLVSRAKGGGSRLGL